MNIQIICVKCFEKKDCNQFYGVQKECKECTKKRARERERLLRLDPDWVEKEKERARNKYHRLGYKEKHKPTKEKKRETMSKYKEKYPEKQLAKQASQRLPKVVKENHLHHWSYNKEHWKDCIELSEKEHNLAHRYMIYDQERMMYRDLDGILLDTKEAHLEYLSLFINKD